MLMPAKKSCSEDEANFCIAMDRRIVGGRSRVISISWANILYPNIVFKWANIAIIMKILILIRR